MRRLEVGGIWLLVVLILLAIAERRIAVYAHWPVAEWSLEDDAAALEGERAFLTLLVLDDSRPPDVRPHGLAACHQLVHTQPSFVPPLRKAASRSPPVLGADPRTT